MFSSERRFDPFSLVLGILFAVMSLVMLRNPIGSLRALIILIAILLIVEGVFKLADISVLQRDLGLSRGWTIFSSVIDIILGILIFMQPSFGAVYIWILISLSFIFDSFFALWASRFIGKEHRGLFWFNVVLGVIGVILGFSLLFAPEMAISVALFLVSFYFMFFGILLIVRSF
ncbi:hypothetical protein B808_396 [Fructilactobacillus florum 8D]|uniref:Acid-resistance membrane protein n=2 Tax=Fructilactobacillus florum TaxID=640331 RepID=W9EEV1_9LACO|nr:DUF308 domain-containing protein [Fructilactobacillus florum]EKK20834.1 hypothetical protein B807_359 [Fructilactobacillus florum 2F]ETO40658.1 hypothetical protein B808_396 [Fructilactobacillus florum 8D]KRM92296.1 hypothetical protein FC87_GL000427 [Fructilactobacillus florum DSM 22689 = JCM 16035]